MRSQGRRRGAWRRVAAGTAVAMLAGALWSSEPRAGAPPTAGARAGLDLADAAARAWAPDASLIYLENDEDLDASGAAERWGYLFYSPVADKARAYSVRGGKIVVAETLDMKFDAPPVEAGWIDSDAALAAAEREAGREFREKHGGRVSAMLLMRGAFDDASPDQTSWLLIYAAPDLPSLFVVVSAADGHVRRTWRG